jgi:hypothetical protein
MKKIAFLLLIAFQESLTFQESLAFDKRILSLLVRLWYRLKIILFPAATACQLSLKKCQPNPFIFVNLTPLRMKKIIFMLFLLLSLKNTIAQTTPENKPLPEANECRKDRESMIPFKNSLFTNDSLPPLSALEESLKMYHNSLWTAQRQELLSKEKFRLFKYLPHLGFSPFTRDNQVRLLPVLSFNASQVFSYLQAKQEQKSRLLSLDQKAQLSFNEELLRLRLSYQKLKSEIQSLESLSKLRATEERIFSIHQEAYQKREISPLDFLEKEKNYLLFLAQLSEKTHSIDLLISSIKQLARYQMSNTPLYYLPAPDCILLQPAEPSH